MTIIELVTPLASEADSGAVLPIWQLMVLGILALTVICTAFVVWAVLRLVSKRDR